MTFRDRLREQIDYLGLLDKEVAERAGITKHAMDTYVGSRACMPSADVAVRLAKALGVSAEWLVTGIEKSDSNSDVQKLINGFYQLSPHDKKLILDILETIQKNEEK